MKYYLNYRSFLTCGLVSSQTARLFILLLAWLPLVAQADSGDNLWNLRENSEDRFHSNESWLRPWRYNYDDGRGRWVGNYSYEFQWGGTSTIGNSDGSFSISHGQDVQFSAWTYVYVKNPTTVSFSGSGDCVPRCFLNYSFDSPMGFATSLSLISGWNRVDITGYNQNDSYGFSCSALANSVDIMNHEVVDAPVANFTSNPSLGWSGTTAFSFADVSSNTPDRWSWDVDNDGTIDYTTKNVSGHIYSAPDGGSVEYSAKLEVGRLIFSDELIKTDIITVFGKPLGDFSYSAAGLRVNFLNNSLEPGKLELGGYSYAWDLDNDGKYDDAFVENPEWTFSDAGMYLVSLQVTNGAGSSFVQEFVTVPEPAPFILIGMAAIGSLVLAFAKRRRTQDVV